MEEESLKTEMDDGLEAGAGIWERNDEAPGLAGANPRPPPSLLTSLAAPQHGRATSSGRSGASGQEGV